MRNARIRVPILASNFALVRPKNFEERGDERALLLLLRPRGVGAPFFDLLVHRLGGFAVVPLVQVHVMYLSIMQF